ncbi:hypothetical protein DL771_002790 [Monosporascus sp. 5C6A]|nr:hypothetical protein DL771_002790 [Monosporascus sp. 5C6A]
MGKKDRGTPAKGRDTRESGQRSEGCKERRSNKVRRPNELGTRVKPADHQPEPNETRTRSSKTPPGVPEPPKSQALHSGTPTRQNHTSPPSKARSPKSDPPDLASFLELAELMKKFIKKEVQNQRRKVHRLRHSSPPRMLFTISDAVRGSQGRTTKERRLNSEVRARPGGRCQIGPMDTSVQPSDEEWDDDDWQEPTLTKLSSRKVGKGEKLVKAAEQYQSDMRARASKRARSKQTAASPTRRRISLRREGGEWDVLRDILPRLTHTMDLGGWGHGDYAAETGLPYVVAVIPAGSIPLQGISRYLRSSMLDAPRLLGLQGF